MGQAKQRGPREKRVAESIARHAFEAEERRKRDEEQREIRMRNYRKTAMRPSLIAPIMSAGLIDCTYVNPGTYHG